MAASFSETLVEHDTFRREFTRRTSASAGEMDEVRAARALHLRW
jgi:hypothetical protein